MPQKFKWDVISKHQLTKIQEKILKEFFEKGPGLRSELNKKLDKKRRGKSYNENLERLVSLKLLNHEERLKESLNLKYTDTSMIKDPKLRRLIKNAFKKNDYGRPRIFSKKKWDDALRNYQMVNYNECFGDKIGESSYSITIWGIVEHLRNESKLHRKEIVFFASNKDKEGYQSRTTVSDSELDLVLKHFSINFSLITRKWDYLCQNNDSDVVYNQLFDSLLLANYYYEILNADFAKFENSALDDIQMNFFIPYTLSPKNAKRWMASIVKDNEIYDYISACFTDLEQNYMKNQDIVTDYKKTLDSFRKGKNKRKSKFLKPDYLVKIPMNRKRYGSSGHHLGDGSGGYHLSNFLNVLDFGPLNYRSSFESQYNWHRKKHKQTRK